MPAPGAWGADTLGASDAAVHRGPGSAAWPLLGSIISDDSSTASNADAGTPFSCEIIVAYGSLFQPASSVPVKNQFDPLSATIRPYCLKALSTTCDGALKPEMS